MDPVLQEIYRTVLDGAPFVLGAYFLLWLGLFGYAFMITKRLKGVEKELAVIEESVSRRGAPNS